MATFELPPVTKFGFGTIDTEHVDIADRINACLLAASADEPPFEPQLLVVLREKMLEHFLSEEALMERLDFPLLPQHRQQHRKILANVDRILSGNVATSRVDLDDVLVFLDGLIEDVLHADLPFKTYLYERGILQ
jgi:hemerythrin-like metal-binding protein